MYIIPHRKLDFAFVVFEISGENTCHVKWNVIFNVITVIIEV